MKFARRSMAIATMLASVNLIADDVLVSVFFEETPLQGIEVSLDNRSFGKTNKLGSAQAAIDSGEHRIQLTRDGKVISTVTFTSEANQDVEISVSFDADSTEPDIAVKKFTVGDDSVTGVLAGTVTDLSGAPVAGAVVQVLGEQASTTTDGNGVYKLELPRGEHTVEIDHPDYSATTIENLRVLAGLGATAMVKLTPTSAVGSSAPLIEEVVVLGSFNPTESSADIERFATSVTDAIDIEQLARFGDSNVAGALARIVGVSITGGKYANVRGLDGRYISSSLNGLLMPSTDPFRRDVQLDLIPANILGGIEIQKTYSPELLGTTTGGSVKIHTKGLPEEKIGKIAVSTGFNLDFTGDHVVSHRSSTTDGLGFDSGLRELPEGVLAATDGARGLTVCDPAIDPVRCTSPLDASLLGIRFEDDWKVKTKEANPDAGLSLAFGDLISIDKGDFGYYAALSYKHGTSERGEAELNDSSKVVGSYQQARETTNVNGYFVTGLEFNDYDEVLSKTILLRSTDDRTRIERGVDVSEGTNVRKAILEFVERQLLSQQFTGHHEFASDGSDTNQLDWSLGYSQTERDEPDRRQYIYLNNVLSTSAVERRWSEMTEDSFDFATNYTLSLAGSDNLDTKVQFGALWSDKSRELELYRFGVRSGSNASDISFANSNIEQILSYQNFLADRIRLGTNTTNTDSYDSDEAVAALYANSTAEMNDLTIVFGVRFEKFEQQLSYPNNDAGSPPDLNNDEILPAVLVTYSVTEDFQLRGGFSQTVSYPGVVERAESLFYDENGRPYVGNPDLQLTNIDNFDVRAEYYFSPDESVSLALFIKEIDKPVEVTILDGSGSAAEGATFRNAKSATLNGVELDANKNIYEGDGMLMFVAGNVSFIDSEVDLDADSLRLEGANTQGRELQGQSKWLSNFQIGLDHFETEQKFTLQLNYFDDRIDAVSRGMGQGSNIELGRTVVDFNYEKLFGESLTFQAQIGNILNDKVEYARNGKVIERYEEGTSISLKLDYQF